METPETVRIDKYLWAVRIYKTRSLASEACRAGKVSVDGQKVKASHSVKVDQTITAKRGPISKTVRVLSLLDQRVSAKLVPDYAEDLTPTSEYQKPKEPNFLPPVYREKGKGRPTKRERRKMDKFFAP